MVALQSTMPDVQKQEQPVDTDSIFRRFVGHVETQRIGIAANSVGVGRSRILRMAVGRRVARVQQQRRR